MNPAMTAERIEAREQLMRDYLGAWNARDPEAIAAFPDLRFELARAAHAEDFTCGEWRSRMTHRGELEGLRATGRVVESAGVDVATIDPEGRIVHLVSYYDGAEIMRDLGLLPGRGSRLERALVRAASLLPRS